MVQSFRTMKQSAACHQQEPVSADTNNKQEIVLGRKHFRARCYALKKREQIRTGVNVMALWNRLEEHTGAGKR